MTLFAVSYDVRIETNPQKYQRIYDYLRTAYKWCTPLYSFWIIESDLLPSEIIGRAFNSGVIDDDDGIIVLEITGVGDFRRVRDDGPVPGQAFNWLNQHVIRR